VDRDVAERGQAAVRLDRQRDGVGLDRDQVVAELEPLEDLRVIEGLADAQLDQRQKIDDLQDAEQELAAVKAKGGKATQEELDDAQLAYDKAVQALKEQQLETKRLEEKATAANKAAP
jgi:hypothetical protein